AAGVRQVVDAQMSDLVRKVTIERGHDPREFSLMAYGGAGPAHAVAYARNLGVRQVIVPLSATAYSALGAAISDTVQTVQRSISVDLTEDDGEVEQSYKDLEATALARLRAQGLDESEAHITRWADMRYERQLHDVRVVLDRASEGAVTTRLAEAFATRYRLLYGRTAQLEHARPVVLRIGVEAAVPSGVRLLHDEAVTDAGEATPVTRRDVYWPEESRWRRTAIHYGPSLRPGELIRGPAIVDHPGTSIVIPADAHGQV